MHNPDSPDDPVDEVLVRYLRAADRDTAPPPYTLVALYPELADELREFFADRDEVESFAAPVRAAILARHFAQTSPRTGEDAEPVGTMLGPYRLDEEIGRGGMGVVYRAWDTALDRPVAVKTIRTPGRPHPEALARFRAEAVAVARLQHPNIVQVFGTGEHAGQPYVVLEYVPGGSLADALTGHPVPPADAAALVETLARAVHSAHRRGVIHRDLKPANILLQRAEDRGQRTEDRKADGSSLSSVLCPLSSLSPRITDFGLAKVLDEGAEPITETGAVLGTPAYMSPEQAHGRMADVGPGSDVYALGVLLYEMLTGRPPFCGVTKLDTLRQVMNDEPVPPRRLVPAVPRDLETVCLKCLGKEPARRYAGADVLADELKRFLDGRPILARPVGPLGRARRWCRRQPWLAGLMAALALCTALLAAQWWRAERNAADAFQSASSAQTNAAAAAAATGEANKLLKEAVEQRERADQRFRTAHGAVRDLAVWVSEKVLAGVPPLQPVRKELLDRAVSYYEGFVRDRAGDPVLRFELADLYFKTAKLTTDIGSKAEALDRYRRAAELYDGLLREDPDNQRYLTEQAYILNNSGSLHGDIGDRPKAAAAYHGALAVYARLRAANPGDLGYQDSTANALYNLGRLESDAGDFGPALDHLGQARAVREGLAKAESGNGPNALKLTDIVHQVAVAYDRLGRTDEAVAAEDRVRAEREELTRKFPKNPDVRLALATTYRFLGDHQRTAGRPDEAEAALKKALAALEEASKLNPNLTRLPVELANVHHSLAEAHRVRGRYAAALDALQRAKAIHERLTRLYPQSVVHKAELAHTYDRTGLVFTEQARWTDAREAYTLAKDLWAGVLAAGPTTPANKYDYSCTLHNLGLAVAEFGRMDEAVGHLRAAAALTREVMEQVPDRPLYRHGLAVRYTAIAEVELKRGRAAAVVETARERVTLYPKDPDRLYEAARDVALAAELPDPDGRRKEYVRLAVDTLRAAAANGFTDVEKLDRERAFAPVRSDPEFRRLTDELRRARPPE